ncbi:MAG: CusA/CzcA family heavy metal efflux RND transporter [Chromatiales bacterium 21-64-14]|nr:MAG: CusA/CzcA family heavy metal efflux RND transporter [Chromatiales bacterium 21-64-14]HQU16327.1 CusA/CzcA family heavy metal efflux RND transporter [Gammaproteobacteria bacterium]
MISGLIRWSVRNRLLVLLGAILISAWGVYAVKTIPLDAIPDLSDVQVIIRTSFPGQAPQVVEDQVTYPLSTAMLSVPGATSVRGYSFFGDSYVYVIFSDKTNLYWARSRVLEYLSQASGQLPKGIRPKLGPDATGVGWIYEYALVDRTGNRDISQLTSLQNWFMKYELRTVPGVAEVATVGGMVKQYQVVVDPDKLRGYDLTLSNVKRAIGDASQSMGGSTLELAESEYMVQFNGYAKNIRDIGLISVPTLRRRISISSVLLDDVARSIRIGPAARRGVADLDGQGEVVGGIVVMRTGENALATIAAVKNKLRELKRSLPPGVQIVETYDRSSLIKSGINTLTRHLVEEFLVVIIVCALFLLHTRSSLVMLFSLPVGILMAFIVMRIQGINANIMSLGGIAIAIGAMVDAAIVMIENAHKHLEHTDGSAEGRIRAIQEAATQVGRPLFFSLLIITLSFVPVFTLEGQEERLFAPLAFTKTYAMAAAAILSVTLVPALMAYLICGRFRGEEANPLNRWLIAFYRPWLRRALCHPWQVLALGGVLIVTLFWPLNRLGTEFMPEMDEGDLLYMPTTLPGISIGEARRLLQQTDRLIKTVPEVKSAFGKIGRAETATDPSPLTMIETVIQFKPKSTWRPGMTMAKLAQELDRRIQIPSLHNAWLMPIRTRIDMQSTGINTPVGIKISGPALAGIEKLGKRIESILYEVPGTRSAFADRSTGARYINVDIDRYAAAHFGLSVGDIEDSANIAIGGVDVTNTVEGRERYPINLRYPRELRDSITKIRELPLIATEDTHIQLQDVADVRVAAGPPMIKSEDARLNGWVYVTTDDRDIGSYVQKARRVLEKQLRLPPGYTISWVGQYQYLERAEHRLAYIIPLTLFIIFILLYISSGSLIETSMIMFSVPFALVGGTWLLWLLGYHLSVAVAVGFIALAGVAAEFGVVMMIYLRDAVRRRAPTTEAELRGAIMEGALLRVRPKAMTAAVIIAGLMPIMFGGGTGSEVMRRIAAPMVGGMVTAPLVSMALIPSMYYLWQRRRYRPSTKSTRR